MLKHQSCAKNDLSPMRLKYWDNSLLIMNRGLPLVIQYPTDIKLE